MMPTLRAMLIPILVLALSGEASAEVITRMSDRQSVTLPQLVSDLVQSDLILVGESHDNPHHHEIQLKLIRSLSALKVPIAIGLEMFESGNQQLLDDWVSGKVSERAFLPGFARNWSQDWDLYRDIFLYARDNRIPMVALNVPKEIVAKVSRHGFASLTPEERKDLPQGTSCDLNNPLTALLRRSFKEVSRHANGRVFDYFCEAQTVRNSGMAINLARYLKKHPGTKIVTLTGIWHAVKDAIPDQLERNGYSIRYRVIVPETAELNTRNSVPEITDYVVGM